MTAAWREQAACRGENPELWFPATTGTSKQRAHAVAICKQCPVRAQCLTYAVTRPELHGIWGGVSEKRRQGMRRESQSRQQQLHGTNNAYSRGCRCQQCRDAHADYTRANRTRRTHKAATNRRPPASK
jgi:WhiB family redox-sensing transcriptional regulator